MPGIRESVRLIRGGIVAMDPDSGAMRRVIALQYNPDQVTRTLQPQAFASSDSGDRSEALRLKGPPVETLRIEAEADAVDQVDSPTADRNVLALGLQPYLATLELLVYPSVAEIEANQRLAANGTLEIVPMQAPLTLFVWSRMRVMPVRITECSITEDSFDPDLNPLRAKITLGMRVLSVNDLGFGTRGADIYLAYQRTKEQLSGMPLQPSLETLGIARIS